MSNSDRFIWIRSTSPDTESIPRIDVDGTGTNLIDIILSRSNSANLGTTAVPTAGVNWGGMTNSRPGIRFIGAISGNLTGGVFASGIWRFDAGGDILSTIQQGLNTSDTSVAAGGPFWVLANKINAQITAAIGSIGFVQTVSDLCGNLVAQNATSGSIGTVQVGGDLGTVSAPVNIFARGVNATTGFGIGSITADNAYANIGSGDSGNPGVKLGTLEIDGDFGTSATVTTFAASIDFAIGGELDGDVVVESALSASHTVRIGGSLVGTIELPSSGLVGQITVNNNDDGGEWDGDVLIDGVALSDQPSYTNTATSIGGGAAGLAPFTHHGTSCVPVQGATIFITGLDIFDPYMNYYDIPFTQAKARLYGPVELVGAAPHVEVLVKVGSSYVDAGFTIETSIVSSTGEREVLIKREYDDPWPEGEYRIVPLAGKMTSKGVEGDPDVDMFWYEFTLAGGCGMMLLQNFDLNEDDTVCMLDAVAWTINPVDLNADSVADEDDFSLLLGAIDAFASR